MLENDFDVSFDLSNPQQTDISLVLLPQTNSESANYYKLIVNKDCDGAIWYSREKLQGFQDDLQRASQFLLTESTKSTKPKLNTKQILFDSQDGLATIGNNVYTSLLQGEALKCLQDALSEVAEGQIPTVHIFAKDFVIQWEWLYDMSVTEAELIGDYNTYISPFWASKYIIARRSIRELSEYNTKQTSRPIRASVNELPIGITIDPNLKWYDKHKNYWNSMSDRVRVNFFSDENISSDNQAIQYFREFVSENRFDIQHIYCHAVTDVSKKAAQEKGKTITPPPHLRVMKSVKRRIQINALTPIEKVFARLLVLNACSAGVLQPLWSIQFAELFRNKDVEHIIAVEADITSESAHEFSVKFYDNFIRGVTLGLSLFLARKALLDNPNKVNNLVALFYCLYGDPYLKIEYITQ